MRSFGFLLAVPAVLLAGSAAAQPAPAGAPPPATRGGPGAPPAGPAAPTAPAAAGQTLPDVPRTPSAELTAVTPGGLTAEQVGQRAMQTSFQAKGAEQTASAASARADGQWANYLPRLGLTARYTRLSDFKPPSFGSAGANSQQSGGSLVGTDAPAGTVNPPNTVAIGADQLTAGFIIPLVLDQYLLQAAITVPISDYFFRIGKAYTAATNSEEAARQDVVAARAKSYADGKIVYFTWLRARGAVVVAEQSLAVAKAHQSDAENQFTVGNASRADVLRAQTQVAGAELALERAKSAVVITERQVRVAMHAPEEEKLAPAESLDGTLAPGPADVRRIVAEAHTQRAEIKSIDKNAEAARKSADVQRGGRYPALSAFGDLTYANPNQRRFPQRQEWFPTWAVGAQVTWSPTDVLVGNAGTADFESRANALEAQRSVVRDGVEIEVTQAYQSLVEADTAMVTTQRQLESALEGYRVARELFKNGRGTGTTLIDAENALAQTRFEHLNARVDARLARIRLEHAAGRYGRTAP